MCVSLILSNPCTGVPCSYETATFQDPAGVPHSQQKGGGVFYERGTPVVLQFGGFLSTSRVRGCISRSAFHTSSLDLRSRDGDGAAIQGYLAYKKPHPPRKLP